MNNQTSTHCQTVEGSTLGRPTIALFADELEFYIPISFLQAATAVAKASDANLLYFSGRAIESPYHFDSQANILHGLVTAANVDGLLIASNLAGSYIPVEAMQGFFQRYQPLPMVSMGMAMENVPSVVLDNFAGMYAMFAHLIEVHGYRRIAFLGGPEKHPEARERYRAYVTALQDHGLAFDPGLVVIGDFRPASGTRAARIWFDERQYRPQHDIQAIVAANDYMTIDLLPELQRRGIKVPEEIAIGGFDDIAVSKFMTPPLTTVRQPFDKIGRYATELLLAQIAGNPIPEVTRIPAEILVRQSCGCAASARNKRGAAEPLSPLSTQIGHILQQDPHQFIQQLNETIYLTGGDIPIWDEPLALLRDDQAWLRPDVQQTSDDKPNAYFRAVLGKTMLLALQEKRRSQILQGLGERVISTLIVSEVMDALAEGLPRLGIRSGYVALYEDPPLYQFPQALPTWSRLFLAYTEHGRIPLPQDGQRFPTQAILPHDLYCIDRPRQMVVEALYFQREQIGFAVFEVGTPDEKTYGALRRYLSSSLQGALLVQRVQERSAELVRQKYILDTFMDNVPDSIYFKDRESRITHANKAHARRLGLSDPAEELGKSDFDFFPEPQARIKYEQEQEIIRTGQPILALAEFDGQGHWDLATKMPWRDEHDTIIGTFGISHDITALKEVEVSLRRLEKAVETTDAGITITDNDGRIVYLNPAEAQMHGYTVTELLGQQANIFAPPELRVPSGRTGPGPAATSYWRRECLNMRKDGVRFPVRLISNPITDADGSLIGKVTVCEDITERKQAEQALLDAHNELREKNVQLAELNASKDTFFSIISHDLRSPFSVMLGFSQFLEENIERYSQEELKTKVKKLRASAEQLYALLENLLTWARIQRGVMEYDPVQVAIAKIVAENIDLFRSKADHKHITLTHAIPPDILVYADANMVHTVLRNLISNALKFTSHGGVDISAQPYNEQLIEVSVTDTGVGLNPDDASKLFRIDARYTNLGTAGEKGTGLGLILCKDLVEKNGGGIWVESDEGKRTTFRFTLPKA